MFNTPNDTLDLLSPATQSQSAARDRFARLVPFLAASALLAGLFCPLAIQFDQPTSNALRYLDLPGDLHKAISLSEVFAHGFGVAVILLSILLIAVSRRRAVMIAILITAISGITANGLKATVVRIRPHAEGLQVAESGPANNQVGAVERSFWDARQRSFPSGHAATAWGLAIGLSLVFSRGWWIFTSLAVFACLQRIESGAHYPSDVLAGAAIAFLCAACILAVPGIRRQLAFCESSANLLLK